MSTNNIITEEEIETDEDDWEYVDDEEEDEESIPCIRRDPVPQSIDEALVILGYREVPPHEGHIVIYYNETYGYVGLYEFSRDVAAPRLDSDETLLFIVT